MQAEGYTEKTITMPMYNRDLNLDKCQPIIQASFPSNVKIDKLEYNWASFVNIKINVEKGIITADQKTK